MTTKSVSGLGQISARSFFMNSYLIEVTQAISPSLIAQKHGSPVGWALAFSKLSPQCFCADALLIQLSYNSHTTLIQLSYNSEGNMEELKTCPFCGKDAIMETFTTALEKIPRFRVRCSNCTADIGWDFFKAEDAKNAWNQRME